MKLNYYFLLPILFGVALLTSNCNSKNTAVDLKDFSIKDTANIYSFTIATSNQDSITITRNNEKRVWMIKEPHYRATKSSVDLIMETFYRIKIKQDVSKNAEKNVIKRLAVNHKRVDIFNQKNELIKTWYIGSPTPDHLGTFMLLKKDGKKGSRPYIMHKPGVYGSLDIRFFTDWTSWRSPQIFHYPNSYDIQSVKVSYNDFDNESFSIKRKNKDIILSNQNDSTIENFDTIQLKHYLTHYNNICYNKIMFVNQHDKDSLFALEPFIEIELHNTSNEKTKVDFWRIKDENSTTGWDKEYGLIRVNGNNELLRAQYFNWDILFKPLSFFSTDIIK